MKDRRAAHDFRAPKDDQRVIGACQFMLPAFLKFFLDVDIRVVGNGLARFHKLKGKHVVITPNHCDHHDPDVLFALAKMVDEQFRFVAAREVYDYNFGITGWFFERLGCYSVVRGMADYESFEMTRNVIASGEKKLVLFPEGEISHQNDYLLPLRSGAIQLFFEAQEDLEKAKPGESVLILPVGLKYAYKFDISSILQNRIETLERKLGQPPAGRDYTMVERVRRAVVAMLDAFELEYNYRTPPDMPVKDKVNKFKETVLQSIAASMTVEIPSGSSHLDSIRILRNAMDEFFHIDSRLMPAFEKQIHEEKTKRIKAYYRSLERVVNFLALADEPLRAPATQEQLAGIISILESEVFGRVSYKGPRVVFLNIGDPIELRRYYSEYQKDARAAVAKVTEILRNALLDGIHAAERRREVVYIS